jgi:hypothetical protein
MSRDSMTANHLEHEIATFPGSPGGARETLNGNAKGYGGRRHKLRRAWWHVERPSNKSPALDAGGAWSLGIRIPTERVSLVRPLYDTQGLPGAYPAR